MSGPQTGVKVSNELIDMFTNGFKTTGVKKPTYDYITAKIVGKEIVKGICPGFNECENEPGLDKASNVPCSFQSLKKYLISQHAGYGLYIFEWKQADGGRAKITQISYCDDNNATAMMKMLYSGSKSAFGKAIGTETQLQFNDVGDFDYKEIIKELSKGQAI